MNVGIHMSRTKIHVESVYCQRKKVRKREKGRANVSKILAREIVWLWVGVKAKKKMFVYTFIGGSSAGSERMLKAPMHDVKSCCSESELQMPVVPAMPKTGGTGTVTTGAGSGSNSKRSNGSRSRSSGSEQSVQTGTGSGGFPQSQMQQPQQLAQTQQQDLSGSRQSFRIAMGNPCEFFVDVM